MIELMVLMVLMMIKANILALESNEFKYQSFFSLLGYYRGIMGHKGA